MAVGEWDERQLCPDGACVGVIGPDGTCKVCGRVAPNWGDERTRGLLDPADEDGADDDDEADDEADDEHNGLDDELAASGDGHGLDDEDGDDEDDDDEDDEAGDDEDDGVPAPAFREAVLPVMWGSRKLCPDGSCIGVIGPSGRCKVCGRLATSPSGELPAASPEPDGENGGEAAAGAATALDATEAARPCPDAACSGVRGSEGQCTICGKVVP